jgi:hypothetical protein
MGKEASPPTTIAEEEDDDDDDVAEGIPSVDASNVANAKVVGASGAVSPPVVVGGGGSVVVDGGGQGGGKKVPPAKQAPPEPLVKPKEPLPVKITKAPKEEYVLSKARQVVKTRIVDA